MIAAEPQLTVGHALASVDSEAADKQRLSLSLSSESVSRQFPVEEVNVAEGDSVSQIVANRWRISGLGEAVQETWGGALRIALFGVKADPFVALH